MINHILPKAIPWSPGENWAWIHARSILFVLFLQFYCGLLFSYIFFVELPAIEITCSRPVFFFFETREIHSLTRPLVFCGWTTHSGVSYHLPEGTLPETCFARTCATLLQFLPEKDRVKFWNRELNSWISLSSASTLDLWCSAACQSVTDSWQSVSMVTCCIPNCCASAKPSLQARASIRRASRQLAYHLAPPLKTPWWSLSTAPVSPCCRSAIVKPFFNSSLPLLFPISLEL